MGLPSGCPRQESLSHWTREKWLSVETLDDFSASAAIPGSIAFVPRWRPYLKRAFAIEWVDRRKTPMSRARHLWDRKTICFGIDVEREIEWVWLNSRKSPLWCSNNWRDAWGASAGVRSWSIKWSSDVKLTKSQSLIVSGISQVSLRKQSIRRLITRNRSLEPELWYLLYHLRRSLRSGVKCLLRSVFENTSPERAYESVIHFLIFSN
jgi:hypothetical protein